MNDLLHTHQPVRCNYLFMSCPQFMIWMSNYITWTTIDVIIYPCPYPSLKVPLIAANKQQI